MKKKKLNFKKILNIKIILLVFMILFANNVFADVDYDIIDLQAGNYNYEPAPVDVGDSFELWIQVKNNSNGVAEDIEYILDLEYPFSLAEFEDENDSISSLAPYQTKIIKYKINTELDANPGTYEIEFKFKRAGVNVYNIEKYDIDLVSQETIVDLVNSDVNDVYIGQKTKVKLDLKNLSNKVAKNIFVTLNDSSNEEVKVMDLKTKYIDKLAKDEKVELTYYILAGKDVEDKSYGLPIEIEYSDNNSEYSVNRNLGIEIIDNPNMQINVLDIVKDSDLEKIKSNSKQSMDLEIFNTGNIDAESVYVEIQSEIVEDSKKYFVGSIEKDNYDTVDIEYKTKDVESGEYELEVIVHYKDGDLKERTVAKKLNVEVIENQKKSGGISSIIMSIVSVIGVIIGLALAILILKWLFKVIVKPAFKDVFKLFKKKK